MLNKEQVFGMYLGRDIYFPKTETTQTLKTVNYYGEIIGCVEGVRDIRNNISDCQLILRPISEITEEEMRGLFNFYPQTSYWNINYSCLIGLKELTVNFEFQEMCMDENECVQVGINADTLKLGINEILYLVSIGICINEEWHTKGWVIYESEANNV